MAVSPQPLVSQKGSHGKYKIFAQGFSTTSLRGFNQRLGCDFFVRRSASLNSGPHKWLYLLNPWFLRKGPMGRTRFLHKYSAQASTELLINILLVFSLCEGQLHLIADHINGHISSTVGFSERVPS